MILILLTFAATPLPAHLSEANDPIIKTLAAQGLFQGPITKIKIQLGASAKEPGRIGPGSRTEKVFYITTQEGGQKYKYVVKVSATYAETDHAEEQRLINEKIIENFQRIITKYEDKYHVKLPHLTTYYNAPILEINGEQKMITVMNKVKGTSLEDIHKDLYNTEKSALSEQEMVNMGKEIGTQMGHLARAFFLKAPKTYLLHGDPNLPNYIYDKKSNQLSLIDLGYTREINYPKGPGAFDNYLGNEESIIKELWWAFFPFQNQHNIKNFLSNPDIQKRHRLGILAGNAFYQAYYDLVKDIGRDDNWETDENSFVTIIQQQKLGYYDKIKAIYPDKFPEIIANLTAPPLDFQPTRTETPPQVGPAPTLDSTQQEFQTILAVDKQILDKYVFDNGDEFLKLYSVIRRARPDYNQGPITADYNYERNIKILQESGNVKKEIQEFVQKLLGTDQVQQMIRASNIKEIEKEEMIDRLTTQILNKLIAMQNVDLNLAKRQQIRYL